ncbi:lysophospholipid acyltransferase family protein [Cellulomonas marina]|uniref:1-acyl-sn-glycerol-3-phosphate acyltransferase n=1 Tax=Cellulomonas marina TaxID=988821 RepID=A0A1I0W0Q6_9CELL|nr:lysophospholipid acyltransferase family protein [Cellulomonas marina]SFA82239.1 1-acyl-sn-glycerol-3-phosphate acyltransferase [Cellulomonas marina]
MKRVFVGPLLRLVYRPWVRGAGNVPTDGPAIFASNHLAVIDSFFLPLVIDRELVFIGKQEYFTGSGLKGRLTAGFMKGVGTIPVDRGGGKASEAALHTGLRRLGEGKLFGIYPEGTRSPDGRLYRGKTGIARLALESGAPVVPVAMVGTDVAQPVGRRIPKVMRIGIVIGEPLDFSRYQGMENDRFILRSVTDEIMYAIMSLSGQEYVDVYAATQKARIASGHPAAAGDTAAGPAVAPGGRPAPDVQVPVPPQDEGGSSVG